MLLFAAVSADKQTSNSAVIPPAGGCGRRNCGNVDLIKESTECFPLASANFRAARCVDARRSPQRRGARSRGGVVRPPRRGRGVVTGARVDTSRP